MNTVEPVYDAYKFLTAYDCQSGRRGLRGMQEPPTNRSRGEILLILWNDVENHLLLNTSKTEDVVIDFCRTCRPAAERRSFGVSRILTITQSPSYANTCLCATWSCYSCTALYSNIQGQPHFYFFKSLLILSISSLNAAATLHFPNCRKINKMHSNSFKYVGAQLMHFYSCIFVHLWMVVAFGAATATGQFVDCMSKRKVQGVLINNRFIITHNYLTSQQKMRSKNREAFQRKLQQTKPGNITYLRQCSDSPRCCATKSTGQIKLRFCFTIEMMKAPEKQLTQKPYVNHTLEFHLLSRSSFNFLFSHAYPIH